MDVRKRIVVVGLVTVLQVEHLYVITLRYQNISVGVKQFALRITEYIIAVKLQQLRAGYAVAFAGAGGTEHNDVLVAVVVVLRCDRHLHGKAYRFCGRQGDILACLFMEKRRNVRRCAPAGTAVLLLRHQPMTAVLYAEVSKTCQQNSPNTTAHRNRRRR